MYNIRNIVYWLKIILLVLFIGGIFYVGTALHNYSSMLAEQEEKNNIDSSFVANKLENVGDLTAAKMIYNGIVEYKDGDIPYVNQKAFFMIYRAEISAGVDLSQIKTEVTDKNVKITLPKVEIQDIDIDENTIKFYDEKSSIFNWINKDDAIKAITVAKDDVEVNGDMQSLIKRSKQQTDILIEALLGDSIGERELIIEYK